MPSPFFLLFLKIKVNVTGMDEGPSVVAGKKDQRGAVDLRTAFLLIECLHEACLTIEACPASLQSRRRSCKREKMA